MDTFDPKKRSEIMRRVRSSGDTTRADCVVGIVQSVAGRSGNRKPLHEWLAGVKLDLERYRNERLLLDAIRHALRDATNIRALGKRLETDRHSGVRNSRQRTPPRTRAYEAKTLSGHGDVGTNSCGGGMARLGPVRLGMYFEA